MTEKKLDLSKLAEIVRKESQDLVTRERNGFGGKRLLDDQYAYCDRVMALPLGTVEPWKVAEWDSTEASLLKFGSEDYAGKTGMPEIAGIANRLRYYGYEAKPGSRPLTDSEVKVMGLATTKKWMLSAVRIVGDWKIITTNRGSLESKIHGALLGREGFRRLRDSGKYETIFSGVSFDRIKGNKRIKD